MGQLSVDVRFRHSSGFTRALLGGYEISGITRLQTGALLTPTANPNPAPHESRRESWNDGADYNTAVKS